MRIIDLSILAVSKLLTMLANRPVVYNYNEQSNIKDTQNDEINQLYRTGKYFYNSSKRE